MYASAAWKRYGWKKTKVSRAAGYAKVLLAGRALTHPSNSLPKRGLEPRGTHAALPISPTTCQDFLACAVASCPGHPHPRVRQRTRGPFVLGLAHRPAASVDPIWRNPLWL